MPGTCVGAPPLTSMGRGLPRLEARSAWRRSPPTPLDAAQSVTYGMLCPAPTECLDRRVCAVLLLRVWRNRFLSRCPCRGRRRRRLGRRWALFDQKRSGVGPAGLRGGNPSPCLCGRRGLQPLPRFGPASRGLTGAWQGCSQRRHPLFPPRLSFLSFSPGSGLGSGAPFLLHVTSHLPDQGPRAPSTSGICLA